MYNKVECITLTCDNCGDIYRNDNSGFSLFVIESDAHEHADNDCWYLGRNPGDHYGKHYCPSCFKNHEVDDDVIIVDESRKALW